MAVKAVWVRGTTTGKTKKQIPRGPAVRYLWWLQNKELVRRSRSSVPPKTLGVRSFSGPAVGEVVFRGRSLPFHHSNFKFHGNRFRRIAGAAVARLEVQLTADWIGSIDGTRQGFDGGCDGEIAAVNA